MYSEGDEKGKCNQQKRDKSSMSRFTTKIKHVNSYFYKSSMSRSTTKIRYVNSYFYSIT